MGIVTHLYSLWGRFWPALLLFPAFLVVMAALGNLRIEHLVIVAVILVLASATKLSRDYLVAALPGVGIGFGYEAMRYLRPLFVTRDRVLGCDLRELELRLFPAGDNLTWADFFSIRHTAFWDVFFAVPYTLFWGISILYGTALFCWRRPRMYRFMWALLLTHIVSFVIWLWLPAAPPWYIQAIGCDIDLGALPNAAGLLRIDALFDISYFESFYSRAPTVFGALPSLHCAFPAVGLFTAWRDARWPERGIHIGYTLWMLAASVYLDHHWLLDGLLGIFIALIVSLAVDQYFSHRAKHLSVASLAIGRK